MIVSPHSYRPDQNGRVGVLDKIEIWSKEKWLKYSEEENLAADEIAERIENLGI